MFQKSDGIEELIISLERTTDSSQQVIWEYHQQKFEFWEEGQLNIDPGLEDYKLVISAKRGEANIGYVALDDFFFEEVSPGSCEIKPAGAEPGASTTSPPLRCTQNTGPIF